jgi:hypothetical protein
MIHHIIDAEEKPGSTFSCPESSPHEDWNTVSLVPESKDDVRDTKAPHQPRREIDRSSSKAAFDPGRETRAARKRHHGRRYGFTDT